MGNIVLLDELTINKIAAGEVIERPASVVKEMVENSIDAGAKNITVEIKNGGISFIKITDNGKGIAKDDVELAFERHATSKIRSADDLNSVKSMGFRGEALASIAAIANVELISKTQSDVIGTRIVVEGGDVLEQTETACTQGTTITVRNLFFNTPVRYKFLKKDFTESGYIEDVLTRIALVHPEIAIKLISSGKTVIQTNGSGDLAQVIYSIYGKEIASNIINVDYEYEYIKIKGVIGKPSVARSNRSNQIFFVNDRYIKDKTLSSAVEQAFKGLLPIGKFAFLVLNMEISPSKVDVNVHPAKLEVRFAEENIAFKSMYHAIKDTLLKSGFMSEREKNNEIKEASKNAFKIIDTTPTRKENYTIEEPIAVTNQTGVNILNNTKPELKESAENKNFITSNPFITANDEIFEKLKTLQEDLKKEVQANPNLQLTDTYKQMEKRYNDIVSPIKTQNTNNIQEANSEKNNVQEKTENFIPVFFEDSKENIENEKKVEIKEENTEMQPAQDSEMNEQTEKAEQEIQQMEKPPKTSDDNKIEPEETKSEEKIASFEEMYKEMFGKEPSSNENTFQESKEDSFYTIDVNQDDSNISMFEGKEEYKKPLYKFIGIAFNTYIILEIDNELYIMDQHAAHERIMYEKVKKNFYEEGEKASQLLLLPDIITLTHKEMDIAKDNLQLFRKAGFIVEEFGENTIKLSGVPEVCIDLDTKELFTETLDEINTVARTAKQEKEEKFIATVACKAAVKANMKLTKEEVDSLMDKLLELPNPFTCPHGRPTVIKMSKYEIERKFARK